MNCSALVTAICLCRWAVFAGLTILCLSIVDSLTTNVTDDVAAVAKLCVSLKELVVGGGVSIDAVAALRKSNARTRSFETRKVIQRRGSQQRRHQ